MNCQFTTLERIPNPNHNPGVLTIKLSYHYFLCTTPDPDIIWVLMRSIILCNSKIVMYDLKTNKVVVTTRW